MKSYLSEGLLSMELRSKTSDREEVKPKTEHCCESQNLTIADAMLAVRCYFHLLSCAVLSQIQDFILEILAPLNKSQKPRAISSIAIGP